MSEEKGKLPFVYSEEYVDKQLRSINKMLEHRNYSLMNGIINISGDIYRSRRINRNNLRKALADPYAFCILLGFLILSSSKGDIIKSWVYILEW